MCTLTMSENTFVLLEDPSAPTHTDFPIAVSQNPQGHTVTNLSEPPHYRATFLTLRPPGALEQLLAQLRARWVSVRQSGPSAPQRGQAAGQQLLIDGNIFAIGTDWLVRVGNVILAGGAVKGMLLEVRPTDLKLFLYCSHSCWFQHRPSTFRYRFYAQTLRTEPLNFSLTC